MIARLLALADAGPPVKDDARIIFERSPYASTLRQVWARRPVRVWVVPADDCVAFPTTRFYRDRLVNLSNEGSAMRPRWIALDRFNDLRWHTKTYRRAELAPVLAELRANQEI